MKTSPVENRRRSPWIRRCALILAACIILPMIFARLENRMIYFPTRDLEGTPSQVGLEFDDANIRTADGISIHGWWVPHDEAKLTVLFFHGNGGNISHRIHLLELLRDLGVSTLMVDYRGYGRSEGRPSEEGLYRDADAALKHLREARGIPLDRIVIFGKSLGGAVAIDLAARVETGGLIVESSFTSIKDMARRTVPILPVHLLVRTRFDSLAKMPSLRQPLLVIHGNRDEVVPFEMGRALYDAAEGTKDFLAVPGAGHNDLEYVGGEVYRERLRTFLARLSP